MTVSTKRTLITLIICFVLFSGRVATPDDEPPVQKADVWAAFKQCVLTTLGAGLNDSGEFFANAVLIVISRGSGTVLSSAEAVKAYNEIKDLQGRTPPQCLTTADLFSDNECHTRGLTILADVAYSLFNSCKLLGLDLAVQNSLEHLSWWFWFSVWKDCGIILPAEIMCKGFEYLDEMVNGYKEWMKVGFDNMGAYPSMSLTEYRNRFKACYQVGSSPWLWWNDEPQMFDRAGNPTTDVTKCQQCCEQMKDTYNGHPYLNGRDQKSCKVTFLDSEGVERTDKVSCAPGEYNLCKSRCEQVAQQLKECE